MVYFYPKQILILPGCRLWVCILSAMKKSLIFKILGATIFVAALLFGVLVVHIYLATHGQKNDFRHRQLSRIDFLKPVDAREVAKIRNVVRNMPGVDATYFNIKDGILVYTYAIGAQTSANVYAQVMRSGKYSARPYLVDASMAKTGCPVIDGNDTFRGKMVRFISSL